MKIDIRIVTCDRTRNNERGVNYIHTTLANFLCCGGDLGNPVSIYVSHPDTSYVDYYSDQFNISPTPLKLSGYQNYVRALTDPTLLDCLLILEDDLDFTFNFIRKLSFWLEKNIHCLENNLIALYTPYHEINLCISLGKDLWKYPKEGFYGTQALLGYSKLFQDCASFMLELSGIAYDMAIKEWLKISGTGLISTVPCFVQHIGVISSIHEQPTHTASGFRK